MTDREDFSDGEEGRWLSISEAAELTGRHANTIRNWIREGRLEHVREEPYSGGTRYLLSEDEMQSMIAIPGPSNALPTTRGGWDRLVAQVRGLAELAGCQEPMIERMEPRIRNITPNHSILSGPATPAGVRGVTPSPPPRFASCRWIRVWLRCRPLPTPSGPTPVASQTSACERARAHRRRACARGGTAST